MLVSKSSVIDSIHMHKFLFTGLFIVSLMGLKDRVVGLQMNPEGVLISAIEFLKISFCFTFTCSIIVLITLIFKFIIQKRTKEA